MSVQGSDHSSDLAVGRRRSVPTDHDENRGTCADPPDLVDKVPRKLKVVARRHGNASICKLHLDTAGDNIQRLFAGMLRMSGLAEVRPRRQDKGFSPPGEATG